MYICGMWSVHMYICVCVYVCVCIVHVYDGPGCVHMYMWYNVCMMDLYM